MTRLNVFLLLAVLASALVLVHNQYESRRLFMALETARKEAHRLEVDHDRLQVERRAQATPLRVEKIARQQLQMRTASPAITQYVSLSGKTQAVGPDAASVQGLDHEHPQRSTELKPSAGQQNAGLAQQIHCRGHCLGLHGLGGTCGLCAGDCQ